MDNEAAARAADAENPLRRATIGDEIPPTTATASGANGANGAKRGRATGARALVKPGVTKKSGSPTRGDTTFGVQTRMNRACEDWRETSRACKIAMPPFQGRAKAPRGSGVAFRTTVRPAGTRADSPWRA